MTNDPLITPLPADRVLAHRGYQRHYPENSPLSIEQAILHGARFVEIDVQFSADGVPVLYHDDTLDRLSGQSGKLSQFHFNALKELTAGEPSRFGDTFHDTRIANLSELTRLLRQYPDVQACVELKEQAVWEFGAEFCLQSIRETLANTLPRCILISFHIDALRAARRFGFTRIAPILRDWDERHTLINELEAELVICSYQRIPEDAIIDIGNCKLAVYEIDDLSVAHALLARGVDFIETFACGELLGTQS
jgi:glycerophosphoryl diester phosphodiesterase